MDLLTKFVANVYPSVEQTDDSVVEGYTDGSPKQIRCLISEARAMAVYERFGIEDRAGAILYTTLDHAPFVKQGYTVDCLGVRYAVSSPVTRKVAGLSSDHALCFLERIG